jgi:hypothetical protein
VAAMDIQGKKPSFLPIPLYGFPRFDFLPLLSLPLLSFPFSNPFLSFCMPSSITFHFRLLIPSVTYHSRFQRHGHECNKPEPEPIPESESESEPIPESESESESE